MQAEKSQLIKSLQLQPRHLSLGLGQRGGLAVLGKTKAPKMLSEHMRKAFIWCKLSSEMTSFNHGIIVQAGILILLLQMRIHLLLRFTQVTWPGPHRQEVTQPF